MDEKRDDEEYTYLTWDSAGVFRIVDEDDVRDPAKCWGAVVYPEPPTRRRKAQHEAQGASDG